MESYSSCAALGVIGRRTRTKALQQQQQHRPKTPVPPVKVMTPCCRVQNRSTDNMRPPPPRDIMFFNIAGTETRNPGGVEVAG